MNAKSETIIQREILLRLSAIPGVRLFRNQVGCAHLQDGRWLSAGLGVGSADLVGWITVDQRAVFLAVEVKRPGEKPTAHQKAWLGTLSRMGGIAICATSADEAAESLRDEVAHIYGVESVSETMGPVDRT
jgi:hypothetical protein